MLGRGRLPIDTPVLRADDLGPLRGDGIFDTTHIRDGQAWLLDEHLTRMAESAVKLELDLPPRAELTDLVADLLDGWPRGIEGAIRLVCTRGPETGGDPTVYATATPTPAASIAARRDGIRVITASIGFGSDAREGAPWLLGGAKTLSYAVNMASLRWAVASGADDMLWVAADGHAMEAPTSSLVWLTGSNIWTVPYEATGILPGITVSHLMRRVEEIGLKSGERMVRPDELRNVDGVWLASSIRGIAEITSLDGVELRRCPATPELLRLLGFAY
jgi:4-amino-4-deoxychorismate lyase